MTPLNVPPEVASGDLVIRPADLLSVGDQITPRFVPERELAEVVFVHRFVNPRDEAWVFVAYTLPGGMPSSTCFLARSHIHVRVLADQSGFGYSRETEDDPTPVSPARVPLHTGGPVGTVSDSTLVVDETPEHYETGGSVGPNPGDHGRDCACGVSFNGFDTAAEAQTVLDQHIRQASA